MAGNEWVAAVVFFAILFIAVSLNECKSLDIYKFPVYTTKLCPQNQNEWKERSSFFNCSGSSYMCFPNENFTELLEFCYNTNRTHITPRTCMYLHGRYSVLNGYNCSGFTHGCPSSSYFSDEVYKYHSCLAIKKGHFLAERHCNSNSSAKNHTDAKSKETCNHLDSTPSDERSDVVWIVVVTLLCVIIAICSIFHWIRRPSIRLACTLKLNGRDGSNITLNQDEKTTFIAKSDQNNDAINTTVASLKTDITEESHQTDTKTVSSKDTSDTITSKDSGICNYDGSPLHVACVRGQHATVCNLIENGANINACDNDGKSPLYLACENGQVNVVELLLRGDAYVNLPDNDGASPLFIASQQGHNDIVDLLINHGAIVK